MISNIERRLAEFVDREREIERFRATLYNPKVAAYVIWGAGGVGKTSLQAKLIHEIANLGFVKSELIWNDTRNHDFLAVMRKIRDDLGPEYFERFTDLVNFFTVPKYELSVDLRNGTTINVADGSSYSNSSTGDIAGVLIKDVMLASPRIDRQFSEHERKARLTDAFVECTAFSLANRSGVIFLDSTEKMTTDTETWIWGELLPAACEGRMGNVKFVLSGRRKPKYDRLWQNAIEISQLKPMTIEHILAYLERRGVRDKTTYDALAKIVLLATNGNMLQVATLIDAYCRLERNREQSEQRV